MKTNLTKIIKYSLAIVLGLMIYFHLMEVFGFLHNISLSAFNGIILFAGIYMYLKSNKEELGEQFNYIANFINGFGIGLLSGVLFMLYLILYMSVINPEALQVIQNQPLMGEHINLVTIPIIIFIESAASGYIFTLISMQYLKRKIHQTDSQYKHSFENE